MPYPWPSFSSFVFMPWEVALDGIGGTWNATAHDGRMSAAGGVTDSVVLISIGSQTRQFDCYLSPARMLELSGFLYQTALFTDWDRPVPDSRAARLDSITPAGFIAVQELDVPGGTDRRIQCTVKLSTQ